MPTDAPYEVVMASMDASGRRPLEVGTLLHEVMETYPNPRLDLLVDDPELDNLTKSVKKFTDHEFGAGYVALAEYPVIAQVSAPGLAPELVSGTLDALYHLPTDDGHA